jgi:hypothetical protein
MIYARVIDGIVTNVESWDEQPTPGDGDLVAVTDGATPFIGYGYTPEAGFEVAPANGLPYFPDNPDITPAEFEQMLANEGR